MKYVDHAGKSMSITAEYPADLIERLNEADCDNLLEAIATRVREMRVAEDPHLYQVYTLQERVQAHRRQLRSRARLADAELEFPDAERATTTVMAAVIAEPDPAPVEVAVPEQLRQAPAWCQRLVELARASNQAPSFYEALVRLTELAERSPLVTAILERSVLGHGEMELELSPQQLPGRAAGSYYDTLGPGVLKLRTTVSTEALASTTLHELMHRLLWRLMQFRGQPYTGPDVPGEFQQDADEIIPMRNEWVQCAYEIGGGLDAGCKMLVELGVAENDVARTRDAIVSRAKGLIGYKETEFSLEVCSHYVELHLLLVHELRTIANMGDKEVEAVLRAIFPLTYAFFSKDIKRLL